MSNLRAVTRKIPLLSQQAAQELDAWLMSPTGGGFTLDQLMELAGLSVAQAIFREYPPSRYPRPLVLCGPGNNGGDGLVASRHLAHFGYKPSLIYPKAPKDSGSFYLALLRQCEHMQIDIKQGVEQVSRDDYQLLVDALFGFGFKGPMRPPFDDILKWMQSSRLPVVSIDVPSGWSVDKGKSSEAEALEPDMLVSLTAPKPASADFKGRFHYLGGRFVPPALAKDYGLDVSVYPLDQQCVRLDGSEKDATAPEQTK